MADDDNAGKKLANFDNMWNAGCGIEPKLRQWRSVKYGKQVLSLTLLVLRRGSLLSARSMSGRSKGGNCPMFKNYMLVCGTAAQHFDNEWLCFNTSFAKSWVPHATLHIQGHSFPRLLQLGTVGPMPSSPKRHSLQHCRKRDETNKASALPANGKLWNAMM